MIVITDGKQTTSKPYTELSVASQGVKNKGVAVYAVGVGKGADVAELREIASSQENVFISASFKELQPVAVEIRKKLCDCKFITKTLYTSTWSLCLLFLGESRVRSLQSILYLSLYHFADLACVLLFSLSTTSCYYNNTSTYYSRYVVLVIQPYLALYLSDN